MIDKIVDRKIVDEKPSYLISAKKKNRRFVHKAVIERN